MDVLTVYKCVGLFVLLLITLIFSCLPVIILKKWCTSDHNPLLWRRLISLANCFGGGVFLGTCLMDLFPECREQLQRALQTIKIKTEFPIAEFVMIGGFLIVLSIEQIVLSYQESSGNISEQSPLLGHSHSTSDHHQINQPINSLASPPEEEIPPPSNLRTFLLVLALSLHSVFEGLAIGLQPDLQLIVEIFVAVAIHKSVIAVTLGLSLAQSGLSTTRIVQSLLLFSVMSPVGVAVGVAIMDLESNGAQLNLISGVLQGVACGTFLYVTFFEILPNEINHNTMGNRILKLLLLVAGFSTISMLILFLPS